MTHSRSLFLLAAACVALFSTSCATSRGFGQDLQKVGNRIESRADATGGAAPAPSATGYTPAPVPRSTGLSSPYATPGVPSAY